MLLRSRGVDIKAYDKVGGAPDPTSKTKADTKGANGKGARKDDSSSSTKVPGVKAAKQSEEEEEGEEVAPSFWVKVSRNFDA